MQGIFPINKEKGVSSHAVVNRLREITGIKTIGHAGTLDPLASGVLVVGIGRWAVKKLNQETAKEKEYRAKIKLGETSATDDQEGQKTKVNYKMKPNLALIKKTLALFQGTRQQVPPTYSAIKIKGKRAYQLARAKKIFRLAGRKVRLKSIRLIKYRWPYLELRLTTGPGYYVRALARDLGEKLKVGGYLACLERTRIGRYDLAKSWKLGEFKKELEKRKIVMTLCLIQKNNKILLGMKKRDFGIGRWNGFGGKVKKGESMENLIKREVREESGLRVIKYEKRGVFIFEFLNKPTLLEVHLFSITRYEGKPVESDEMRPEWFDLDKIPYDKMWPDDKFWLPLFLKGKNLRGEFYFKDINNLIHYSLREVKKLE